MSFTCSFNIPPLSFHRPPPPTSLEQKGYYGPGVFRLQPRRPPLPPLLPLHTRLPPPPQPSLNEAFSSRKRLAPFDKAVNFGRGEWGVSSGSLQSAALTDAAGERAQETALKTDRQTQSRKSIEVGSDTETQEHSICLHTYTHTHTDTHVPGCWRKRAEMRVRGETERERQTHRHPQRMRRQRNMHTLVTRQTQRGTKVERWGAGDIKPETPKTQKRMGRRRQTEEMR